MTTLERGETPDLEAREKATDYYLANPPLQPKAEIADYVESQGIPVPRRFSSLDEAIASGKSFIIRSEHPQDYAGSSDLFRSWSIKPKMYRNRKVRQEFPYPLSEIGQMDQKRFEEALKRFDPGDATRVRTHCSFQWIDYKTFLQQASYSYWEELPGYNRTIVADSAVAGRYHIFTLLRGSQRWGHEYATFDSGAPRVHYSMDFPKDYDPDFSGLVSTYERVRTLERFNPSHCPMMEMQTLNGEHNFLQYHRTRDEELAEFTIRRQPRQGEMKAVFVRGATPKDGITFKVDIYDNNVRMDNDEEAAVDLRMPDAVSEIMSRQRRMQIVAASDLKTLGARSNLGHLNRSLLFKPEISVALRGRDLATLISNPKRPPRKPLGLPGSVKVRVVSDGTTAFLKRVR